MAKSRHDNAWNSYIKGLLVLIGCLMIWQISFANGFPEKYDAASAKSSKKTTVIYQTPTQPKTVVYRTVEDAACCANLYPGSLKSNLVRIAHRFGWNTVVWGPQEDFLWIGHTRICARSVQALFNKIVGCYPLQAAFYMGNRVLAIVPRNLP